MWIDIVLFSLQSHSFEKSIKSSDSKRDIDIKTHLKWKLEGLKLVFSKRCASKIWGVSEVRFKKLDFFTLKTLKNDLIRNFLRNGSVRVKHPINFKFYRYSSVRDEKRVFKTSSRQHWCHARMKVKLFFRNILQVLKPSFRPIFQKIGSQEAITRSKHMFIGKELFKKLLKWGRESVFRTYKQRQNRFFAQIN